MNCCNCGAPLTQHGCAYCGTINPSSCHRRQNDFAGKPRAWWDNQLFFEIATVVFLLTTVPVLVVLIGDWVSR